MARLFNSADGSTVGSIASKDGDLAIGTGDTGLRFIDGSEAITPHNTSTNAGRDNAIDLGSSGSRFKDLLLSGKSQADSYQFAQNSSATGATEAIYRATTGTIAVKTNSTERMRIDSSGNLLVNRTSGSSTSEQEGWVIAPFGYAYTARDGTSNQTHILFINNAAVSATAVGSIKTSGSTTSYNTKQSDYRLKENGDRPDWCYYAGQKPVSKAF